MLNNNRYGFNQLDRALQGCQGLLQSVPSLQVSVAMLYYGIVMALLAQGLLQSVHSLQVNVAMPYYSIVMVSIGVSSGSAS